MTTEDDEDFAEEKLIEAVRNQLDAGEPAAAQATYNKLSLVGYAEEDILHLMALVLAGAIRRMLENEAPFDGERYEQELRALPDLPEEP